MRVLVVNAGSSSLKLSLLSSGEEPLAAQELAAPRAVVDDDELRTALDSGGLGNADAVGHRIVHGGSEFRSAVVVDASVRRTLGELVDLAPLHQPKSLAALDAVSAALPGVPAVACFDTAFHATLSDAAATYALPATWNSRWQLRRYGFHGLSHAWIASRAPALVGLPADGLRIVSCHLGAGASLCAISGGRSVDTTMGFTPLEGLVMATRSGSVDPGLMLWLIDQGDVSEADMGHALEHESGLLGLAGTADMREVLARAGAGDTPARLALDVYLHRLRAGIGSMAAALGGVDVLAFTGGVGENNAEIRADTDGGLAFLGVAVDPALNAAGSGDFEISARGAAARTVVIRAREDLEIASQVRSLLAS
ncbi:MAG TPA: acetate/propionate family kinase [Solirubrobacteraceae bacterium]|nr:acetate/propionate family kinase [Solirubrobacteraceae bacterium]